MKINIIFLLAIVSLANNTFGQAMTYGQIVFKTSDSLKAKENIMAPQFLGGKDSLNTFLKKNFKYERKGTCSYPNNIRIQFTVEETGEITNIKYIKPADVKTYKETMRVVELMPKWEPARENGKPIKTIVTLPIYLN